MFFLTYYVLFHIIAQPQTVKCGVFGDETIPIGLSLWSKH